MSLEKMGNSGEEVESALKKLDDWWWVMNSNTHQDNMIDASKNARPIINDLVKNGYFSSGKEIEELLEKRRQEKEQRAS